MSAHSSNFSDNVGIYQRQLWATKKIINYRQIQSIVSQEHSISG